MAASVLGSTDIASGGSATPTSGTTKRVVAVISLAKSFPMASSLTTFTYNSVGNSPTSTGNDTQRDTFGGTIFKNSDLPAGSATGTATWSGAISGDQRHILITCDGIDQTTTTRTSPTIQGANTATVSLSFTNSIGDLLIVGWGQRSDGGVTTPPSGWTELYDAANADGGHFYVAYKVATSTNESYSHVTGATDDTVAGGLVLIPDSGGGGGATTNTIGRRIFVLP